MQLELEQKSANQKVGPIITRKHLNNPPPANKSTPAAAAAASSICINDGSFAPPWGVGGHQKLGLICIQYCEFTSLPTRRQEGDALPRFNFIAGEWDFDDVTYAWNTRGGSIKVLPAPDMQISGSFCFTKFPSKKYLE